MVGMVICNYFPCYSIILLLLADSSFESQPPIVHNSPPSFPAMQHIILKSSSDLLKLAYIFNINPYSAHKHIETITSHLSLVPIHHIPHHLHQRFTTSFGSEFHCSLTIPLSTLPCGKLFTLASSLPY